MWDDCGETAEQRMGRAFVTILVLGLLAGVAIVGLLIVGLVHWL
jgi:hypothetical protein